eukprot:CAMPEP_0172696640 /NCGR_PEP_ID=MMETSP1074-20121228/28195_1 /TAXON_ID=2916 /ORGANISM="Ceratium fusus, Strain PA161109" /LENGTH=359 /DNA_ID=CAMNT_0013517417 /DNA_START=49 /DNA_END=1128 /DNA_ORIENTATION=-
MAEEAVSPLVDGSAPLEEESAGQNISEEMVSLLGDGSVCSVPLYVGCWAWGDDKSVWGWDHTKRAPGYDAYDKGLTENSIAAAFNASLSSGVTVFDTAEAYGTGLSEQLVGQLVRQARQEGKTVYVATKFSAHLWGREAVKPAMMKAARESCRRLGLENIDLYQIHNPGHPSGITAQAHALADVYQSGLARSVGVSNFSVAELQELLLVFNQRGVPLASNQVEFSLLRQIPLEDGMKTLLDEVGAKLLAYSPLAMGRLTGKYSAQKPPPGRRGFSNLPWQQIQPVVDELVAIGQVHGKTPAQVALNWVICQGVIPIAGAKNQSQASENAGALGWRLSPQEVARLGVLGQRGGYSNWQHG